MRLIDGDALMKKLGIAYDCRECDKDKSPYCTWKPDAVDVCQIINDAPTIEERKKGKWIPVMNGRGGHCCNRCNGYAPSYRNGDEHLSDFCPNCGADMRGENVLMIKLVDARKGLHEKCVELFNNEKVAESIYMYLCDGIEECDAVEPEQFNPCTVCQEFDCSGCKFRREANQ